MLIDILCKVIDNYGDIGVVYRLIKAIQANSGLELRLIIDGLKTFTLLEPGINPEKQYQKFDSLAVYSWEQSDKPDSFSAFADFVKRPPSIVLECFACGRPDWFEEILFEDQLYNSRNKVKIRHIINIEYLTSEKYAEEYHLMPSITRSGYVKKHFFMPGFTKKTGGLIIDQLYSNNNKKVSKKAKVLSRTKLLQQMSEFIVDNNFKNKIEMFSKSFWILLFSYEMDYSDIMLALAEFSNSRRLLVFVAYGKSRDCFYDAWLKSDKSIETVFLPFIPQNIWDNILYESDFSLVRGEDSWSRAALSGKPFLWQAYKQKEDYQLVKIEAFLSILQTINNTKKNKVQCEAFESLKTLYKVANSSINDGYPFVPKELLLNNLKNYTKLLAVFKKLKKSLLKNGDLCEKLLAFLQNLDN